ncbi:unnamed protein product [Caenorhabditis auriculariae]|uniref:Uncharacterized protein n=1 Tax=Caenorhabditis auriculariae TaxID=2777116 RepID=A0A8S1HGN9_9PELO|nr:unnamed protein product [Caenorhabditis auriculariae]
MENTREERRMLFQVVIFIATIGTVSALTCTSCEYQPLDPQSTQCNDTCDGDVCFIVVNKFFNSTINAGCINLKDGDKFKDKAVCQRTDQDNRCACDNADQCNDPQAKLSDFTFVKTEILKDYQMLPQVEPSNSSVQNIASGEGLALTAVPLNGTMDGDDDDHTVEVHSSLGINNSTEPKNEPKKNETEDMVMTKTVGLKVGNNQTEEDGQDDLDSDNKNATIGSNDNSKIGPSRGWGSVEMANVTSYRGQPADDSNSTSSLTTSSTKTNTTKTEKDPNSGFRSSVSLASLFTLLLVFVAL